MATPALTVGLLTWNGVRTLPSCLAALADQTSEDWALVIVDNDSRDGSRELVAGWCATHLPADRWQLVRMRRNSGYAAGMNAIAARSQAPLLLALNQDVGLDAGYIKHAISRASAQSDTAAWCGLIYRTPDLATERGRDLPLDSTGHLLFRDRIVMNRHHGALGSGLALEAGEVFGCPGSCPIYRRSSLDAIRYPNGDWWDSRFFAYLEDVDLDYRFRLAGFACRFDPGLIAWHQPHGSGGRATFAIRFRAHMNRYRVLAQHETFASLLPDLGPIFAQEVYQLLRTTLTNPLLHLSALPFVFECLTGGYRNRHGGQSLDRRWIEQTPRWRLKPRP